ncbi:hypothetical protein ACFO5R_11660 [Halosolutus amylolyticus]|uniref:Uncharacterized protein n=1 Tax=Halosolutus amylolyticus TaxID=2932267 RepID=A0ABD5PPV0_9EURY|nr:hypothetical protein [Halosolutus amylolyticus]
MDKESVPQWGWLLLGLFAASMVAQLINVFVLSLPEDYQTITIIAAMSPVLIYVGVWYDEDRSHYWENSREHIAGDVLFVVSGAAIGSAIALVVIVDLGVGRFVQDIIGMAAGFLLSWGLFWWRNPEVYRTEADR